jgi:hypothetical protein
MNNINKTWDPLLNYVSSQLIFLQQEYFESDDYNTVEKDYLDKEYGNHSSSVNSVITLLTFSSLESIYANTATSKHSSHLIYI